MTKLVAVYIDADGIQTVISEAEDVELLLIDERKAEPYRTMRFIPRMASCGIIEALVVPWPMSDRGLKAAVDKKTSPHLKVVGGNG